ncbi:metalloendopeptidase OMA1, mitochondrial-like [Centruroides sculpturatus]|uniref:metalloendopeptidase OMA1, mitochondrial-like n=1 Tax=Centruroides sculpturatus TaxID=218467 RepID=UPI000C6D6D3C|nr:metalloendopeptidase OMA1, mitochondrial-like [Centruroides sculpturatus]XP_023239369.1 metalloendopeptidase OMA1, mitochondrial-like [Centruroides sculpturatus]XP_023239370.1 metalloendopeptidase OMA1, mitochondrial-like [Centruroides sculpturatus]
MWHHVSFCMWRHLNSHSRLIKAKQIFCINQSINRSFGITFCKNSAIKVSCSSLHTTKAHGAPIMPIIMMMIKPISKFIAIITGRGARKWWKSLPPHKKKYFLESAKRNKYKIAGFTLFTSGMSAIYYYSHIQETPFTKRKRFIALTPEQFEQIADFQFKMQLELNKSNLLSAQHPACKRVANVANQLLDKNQEVELIHNKKWTIAVIDSNIQNAFVLPNGQIFVFTGMLNLCENNDQLGVILGHEMAHCILGHAAEALSFTHFVDIALITVLAAIWMIIPSDGIALITQWFFNKVVDIIIHLPYNRKLEIEADEVGLILAAKACFDVRESSAFWSKMSILNESDDGPDIEWLSTHPSNEKRSNYLDKMMDGAIEIRKTSGCPLLTRKDPRLNISTFKKLIEDAKKIEEKYTTTIVIPNKRS